MIPTERAPVGASLAVLLLKATAQLAMVAKTVTLVAKVRVEHEMAAGGWQTVAQCEMNVKEGPTSARTSHVVSGSRSIMIRYI